MFIADTLSLAYPGEVLPSEEVRSLELASFSVSASAESARDPVCAGLRQVILEDWPSNIHECDPVLRPFFQFRMR